MSNEQANSTISKLAQAYWQEWVDSAGNDADALQYYTLALVNEVLQAAQLENWERVEQYLAIYNYGISYCCEEPLLTGYEHGLMHINLILADSCYCLGLLDETSVAVRDVEQVLTEGDKRRNRFRSKKKANSEVRFTCLGLRAACMFEQSLTSYIAGEDAQKLVKQFWGIAAGVESYFQEHRDENTEYEAVLMRSLALWELEICKLCLSCAPKLSRKATEALTGATART